MREIISLFVQIALLRRGPQDLPASRTLLLLSVCAYAALTALVSELLGGTSLLPLAADCEVREAWLEV